MSANATPFEGDIFVLSPELSETQRPLSMLETPSSVTEEMTKQAEQCLLVMRALQSDEKAFCDIVDLYSTFMLRTATMIVANHHIAEDAVQDAFIQAWYHLPDLREAEALRPWLMRIVINQCLSFRRRLARTTAFVCQALSEQEIDLTAQIADYHKGPLNRIGTLHTRLRICQHDSVLLSSCAIIME